MSGNNDYLSVLQIVPLEFLAVAFLRVERAVVARNFGMRLASVEVVVTLSGCVEIFALPPSLSGGPMIFRDSSFSSAALPPLFLGLFRRVRLVAVVRHLVAVSRVRHRVFLAQTGFFVQLLRWSSVRLQ